MLPLPRRPFQSIRISLAGAHHGQDPEHNGFNTLQSFVNVF
jgi:hypothetical protein